VDDHYLVRVGPANVLGFELDMEACAQAESGEEALALPCDELTGREQQVLALVVEGASNAHTARKLGIAGSTVKNHISSIFGKLGVTQRMEAVAVAIRPGIVRIE